MSETAEHHNRRLTKAAETKADILVKRELRLLRRELSDLVTQVAICCRCLDDEMKKPASPERGGRIAKITNALEMQKDSARHFGLHQPLKKNKK